MILAFASPGDGSRRVQTPLLLAAAVVLTVRFPAAEAQLQDEQITLRFNADALLTLALGSDAEMLALELQDASRIMITVPVAIRRRGQELRLVYQPSGPVPGEVDAALVGLIARAHHARDTLIENASDVTDAERPHLTRFARLSYLAPDVQAAIVDGRQPLELTARQLLRAAHLPACWKMQRQVLVFAGCARGTSACGGEQTGRFRAAATAS